MAFLKVKNRAFSTLASGVSDSDTSWTLATGEGAKFPTSGDFHVTCEDEIVKCTSRSTDVLTVVRAQEGTSNVAHVSGKAVELRITAEIITRLQKQLWDDDGDTGFEAEQSADEDKIHGKVAGVEAFLLSDVGILSLAKQSTAATHSATLQTCKNTTFTHVILDAEDHDVQNELDVTLVSGTADATSANQLKDTGAFTEAATYYVGRTVWNSTDHTYTTVTGKTDNDTLDLADDIMVDTETYKLYFSRFTATVAGRYQVNAAISYPSPVADTRLWCCIYKNDALVVYNLAHISSTATGTVNVAYIIDLAATDYVNLYAYQNGGSNETFGNGTGTFLAIIKIT